MRRLLTVLVVLLLLAVAVDRVADLYAERRIGSELQRVQGLKERPDVDITGFPFLTQAARRRFDRVDVRLRSVDRGPVRIDRLTLRLSGVRPNRALNKVHVRRLSGDALVTFADVEASLDQPGITVGSAGNGRARVTGRLTVLGRSVQVSATSRVDVGGPRALALRAVRFRSGLPAADSLLDRVVGSSLDIPIALDGLPAGLRVRSARVTSDGLVVTVAGSDLDLVR